MRRPDQPPSPEQEPKLDWYNLFAEVSGADAATVRKGAKLFEQVGEKSPDAFSCTKELRHHLIKSGFRYDDDVFQLQDMLKEKKGNCLGLSLLIGAELRRRGYSPEYQIILRPKDAVDRQDARLFDELMNAEHFDYDKPELAAERAQHAGYRFAPLEHPSLILDGQRFETTGLDEEEEDPGWSPDAEFIRTVGFNEAASNVSIDRAKVLINSRDFDTSEVKKLAQSAITHWPENREAWSLVFEIAMDLNDRSLMDKARRRYRDIGGDDSRFYFTRYKMQGDSKDLDLALERFPAYMEPFVMKRVRLEKDDKEARFNLAVASWCFANSSVLDLKHFYEANADLVEKLYGKKRLQTLLKKL